MAKKINRASLFAWLMVGVIGVLAVGTVAFAAFGGGIVTNNFYDNSTADQRTSIEDSVAGEEAMLGSGGSSFVNSYMYAGRGIFTDGQKGLSFGTFAESGLTENGDYIGATTTDGYKLGIGVITLENTTTGYLAVSDLEGEDIWIYDAAYTVQTATTTGYRVIMGTTTPTIGNATVGGITQNGSSLVTGSHGGDQSILDTSGTVISPSAQPDNATSTFWKLDFPGTDTRDNSGVNYVVHATSGDMLTCYASTTFQTIDVGTFGGQCIFFYKVLKD